MLPGKEQRRRRPFLEDARDRRRPLLHAGDNFEDIHAQNSSPKVRVSHHRHYRPDPFRKSARD